MKFNRIQASNMSLSKRVLICGVGDNDAWYTVRHQHEGKQVGCPIYNKWSSMIIRCYSPDELNKRPAYRDCVVSQD